ncbi:unnamed protein product [Eruca vesicaria subsp. sativa]|uniref:Uncharacterized protein n=1 Tax=Eruca vesicaria subsp. sativa TaxID=29727 RepID=A0ABC8JU39_ERUVS|nr:unnamed protein product [Eruca vesicaria subsp. sativa]
MGVHSSKAVELHKKRSPRGRGRRDRGRGTGRGGRGDGYVNVEHDDGGLESKRVSRRGGHGGRGRGGFNGLHLIMKPTRPRKLWLQWWSSTGS